MNKKYNFFKKYLYLVGMFISATSYASDYNTINRSRSETPNTQVSDITYIKDFINSETLEHCSALSSFNSLQRKNTTRDKVSLMVQTHIFMQGSEFHGHGSRQYFCTRKEEAEEAWNLILKNAGYEDKNFKFLKSW